MKKLAIMYFVNIIALLTVDYLYGGTILNPKAIVIGAAFVLIIFNAILKPIITIISLPVTILTLGLFMFLISGIIIWIMGMFIHGMNLTFTQAIITSIIISVANAIIKEK